MRTVLADLFLTLRSFVMLAHIPDRLPTCTCWNNRSLRQLEIPNPCD